MRYILLAFTFATSFNSNAFDIKGIELDKKSTWEDISNKLNLQCHDRQEGGIFCSGDTTLAGKETHMYVSTDASMIVDSISAEFNSEYFEEIRDALIQKFGKPKRLQKSVISNAMGANFNQEELSWENPSTGSLVKLDKFYKKVTEGNLMIISNSRIKKLESARIKSKSDI